MNLCHTFTSHGFKHELSLACVQGLGRLELPFLERGSACVCLQCQTRETCCGDAKDPICIGSLPPLFSLVGRTTKDVFSFLFFLASSHFPTIVLLHPPTLFLSLSWCHPHPLTIVLCAWDGTVFDRSTGATAAIARAISTTDAHVCLAFRGPP